MKQQHPLNTLGDDFLQHAFSRNESVTCGNKEMLSNHLDPFAKNICIFLEYCKSFPFKENFKKLEKIPTAFPIFLGFAPTKATCQFFYRDLKSQTSKRQVYYNIKKGDRKACRVQVPAFLCLHRIQCLQKHGVWNQKLSPVIISRSTKEHISTNEVSTTN